MAHSFRLPSPSPSLALVVRDQWSAQPVPLQLSLALAFTTFLVVKWAMYRGPLFSRGHSLPAPEGVLVFALLAVWLVVANASRCWRPSTRAQLAAAEVSGPPHDRPARLCLSQASATACACGKGAGWRLIWRGPCSAITARRAVTRH